MKKEFERKVLTAILITIIILLTLVGAVIQFIQIREEANILVFYHWWTSAGEQAAVNALIDVFSEHYPDTLVVPTPVVSRDAGGGGMALFNLVRPMVFAKEAPDAFQMHAGYETKIFVDAGLLYPLDKIWESEGLIEVVPRVVQSMCQFQGHYYSIPVNIHRTNVVWYNKKILDGYGIVASDLNTWDSFFEACETLRASGIEYPIQMGTSWTVAHTFDQIIASLGIEFYEDWINGRVISADDSRLLEAFNILERYISYANKDNFDLTWDEATGRIISGEGVFNVMGDWANGEFKAREQVYDVDYGSFEVPGTENMYGIVIDSFQRPRNIKHVQNAERWLKIVASKEGQDAFNPIKGSISARIDTNSSKYDLYQQSAILDFLITKSLFPAVSNGLPKSFEEMEQQIISEFAQDLDKTKAISAITSYTQETASDYTITWELD